MYGTTKKSSVICSPVGRHFYPRLIEQPWAPMAKPMWQVAPPCSNNRDECPAPRSMLTRMSQSYESQQQQQSRTQRLCSRRPDVNQDECSALFSAPRSLLTRAAQSYESHQQQQSWMQGLRFKRPDLIVDQNKKMDSDLQEQIISEFLDNLPSKKTFQTLKGMVKEDPILQCDLIEDIDHILYDLDKSFNRQNEEPERTGCEMDEVNSEIIKCKNSELMKANDCRLASIEQELIDCELQLLQVNAKIASQQELQRQIPKIDLKSRFPEEKARLQAEVDMQHFQDLIQDVENILGEMTESSSKDQSHACSAGALQHQLARPDRSQLLWGHI